jgi:1-acyl-sn-glycerol-3-phosphate acyltransferase
MKKLWYLFVKYYMRLGFAFYFKKIQVSGVENIPKNKAILFVANHQNALIDPLLIGALTPRELNFLTRSDVFSTPLIKALLSSVNMLPIYRMKDGLNSLAKNEEVFQKCYSILNKKGTVLIFPEGNHNIKRRLRILSKGFTRIVHGALEENPEQEIYVLPIGINYTNAKKYGSSLHLIYGKPIKVEQPGASGQHSDLKKEVSESLKKLISHIDDLEHYDEIEKSFKEEDFMDPVKVNHQIQSIKLPIKTAQSESNQFNFLAPFIKVNSFIPMLIWKKFYPKIGEEEFISTFRFTFGITLFPLTYLLQGLIIGHFFGNTIGISYLLMSFIIAYLYVKSQ